MDQPTTVTKDELKVALLENNEKLVDKFNASIDHSADKITKAVQDRTNPFVQSFTELAERVGKQHTQIEVLENKVGNLWSKMIGVGAACVTVGGLLGFFIEQTIK